MLNLILKIAKMFSVKTNMGSVTLVTVEDISRVHKSLIETCMYSRGGGQFIFIKEASFATKIKYQATSVEIHCFKPKRYIF
jgi:hypothetical protein